MPHSALLAQRTPRVMKSIDGEEVPRFAERRGQAL